MTCLEAEVFEVPLPCLAVYEEAADVTPRDVVDLVLVALVHRLKGLDVGAAVRLAAAGVPSVPVLAMVAAVHTRHPIHLPRPMEPELSGKL